MKKTMAVVVMLAAALSLVSAKSSKKYSFTAGAHALAGYDFGKYGDALGNGDSKANIPLGGGLWINFPLVQGLCIQPEVNYMYNLGQVNYDEYKVLGVSTGRKGNETRAYSSIDLGCMFTYKIESINIVAGPTVSFPISDMVSNYKMTKISDGSEVQQDPTTTAIDTLATFGFQAGANTNVRFGLGQIVAGARFMMDFTPTQHFNKNSNGEVTSKETLYKRMGVIAEVGYRFAL